MYRDIPYTREDGSSVPVFFLYFVQGLMDTTENIPGGSPAPCFAGLGNLCARDVAAWRRVAGSIERRSTAVPSPSMPRALAGPLAPGPGHDGLTKVRNTAPAEPPGIRTLVSVHFYQGIFFQCGPCEDVDPQGNEESRLLARRP